MYSFTLRVCVCVCVCVMVLSRYGADRTGLFIAMMNMLDAMSEEEEVDVFNAVKRIRQSRPQFIPTIVNNKTSTSLCITCTKVIGCQSVAFKEVVG